MNEKTAFFAGLILPPALSVSFKKPDTILALVALASFALAYFEFVIKRRPIMDLQIITEYKDAKLNIKGKVKNFGEVTAFVKIEDVRLKIGDELYPTPFVEELLCVPQVGKHEFGIGHVNQTGIDRIINSKYVSNTIEIKASLKARSFFSRNYKYTSKYHYEIKIDRDNNELKFIVKVLSEGIV